MVHYHSALYLADLPIIRKQARSACVLGVRNTSDSCSTVKRTVRPKEMDNMCCDASLVHVVERMLRSWQAVFMLLVGVLDQI